MSDPFQKGNAADHLDIEFSVPMVHRLRFTRDCFGSEFDVVARLLDHAPGTPARVQVWIDGGLLEFDPGLKQRVEKQLAADPRHTVQAGRIEVLCGGEDVKNDPQYVDQVLRSINDANLDR